MGSFRRVSVVTRTFWPAATDASLRLQSVSSQFMEAGGSVSVFTPRWHRSWPRRLDFASMRVVRVDTPPLNSLQQVKYARELISAIQRSASELDWIYCDSLGPEAISIAANSSLLNQLPLVVRFQVDDLEPSNLSLASWTPSAKHMLALHAAALIVVENATAEQKLISIGVSPNKLLRVTDGVQTTVDRSARGRDVARHILANANSELFLRSIDRLVVFPGDLSYAHGVDAVIKALSGLVERHRTLHVWLLGDGMERDRVWELLRSEGVHRLFALPGIFTEVETVLAAADLVVLPNRWCGAHYWFPNCIANSIPVLAPQSITADSVGFPFHDMFQIAEADTKSMETKVQQWLKDPRLFEASMQKERVRYAVIHSRRQNSLAAAADVLRRLADSRDSTRSFVS